MAPYGNAMPASRSRRIPSLQVVRGGAALLVVLDHSIQNIGTHAGVPSVYENLGFQCGRFGVLVFFVISGFIMVYTSYDAQGPRMTTSDFAVSRLRRIVPLYWVVTALAIALIVIKTHHLPRPWDMLGSLLFLPLSTSFGVQMNPLVGQGWTLYYEAMFYLTFALCLSLKGLRGIYVTSAIMSGLVLCDIVWSFFDHAGMPGLLRFYCQPIIILFVAGILIGVCRSRAPNILRVRYPLIIVTIATLVALAEYWFLVNTPELPPVDEILYYLLASVCVAACVYATAGPMTAVMQAGVFLGDASYSIYLVHNIIVGALGKVFFSHFGRDAAGAYVVLAIVAAVLGGCLLHVAVERPITKLLTGRRSRTERVALSAPARATLEG